IHVTATATTITPSATVSIATGAAAQWAYPRVASDGTGFFVTWGHGGNDIRGALVTSGGGLNGAPFVVAGAPAALKARPHVAYDGGQYVVVWMDERAGNWDIYSARVQGGTVVDPSGTVVSADATDEILPAVASAGGRLSLIAYDSFSNGSDWRVEART